MTKIADGEERRVASRADRKTAAGKRAILLEDRRRVREGHTESNPEGKGRGLFELIGLVRDGIVALVIAVVLGVLIGVAVTLSQDTEYEAKGSVVVSAASGFLSPENADAYPALTDTARRLLKTPAVLVPTRDAYVASAGDSATAARRRATASLDWLRSHLRGTQVSISSIIEITGMAPDQSDATDLTRAATGSLAQVVGDSEEAGADTGSGRRRGIEVRVFSPGEAKGQVSPTPARNLFLGANAGLLVGLVAALALGATRRVLRRPEEVAAELGVPLFGALDPASRNGTADRGVAEVRARLQAGHVGQTPTVLLLTGVVSPEAIARVATKLVHSMSASGLRTVLVDADIAHGALSAQLGMSGSGGLSDLLTPAGRPARDSDIEITASPGYAGLCVLPAGESLPDPGLALSGPRLGQAIESLRARFDFVVLVGPTMDSPAEVIPLLEWVDQVLLVASRGIEARRLKPVRRISDKLDERFIGALVIDSDR